MEAVLQLVQRINFYLSDYILVFLLIGTGLYFSVRTRFVQVRCFGEGMRADRKSTRLNSSHRT